MPSWPHRLTSTIMAAIDFFQRASSGLARLIRYGCVGHGILDSRFLDRPAKGEDLLVRQGRHSPLVAVLGEELDRVEANGIGRWRRRLADPPAIDM